IGENRDERAGDEASDGAGAGEKRDLDAGGSGRADGAELPANQAAVEALPEQRRRGTGAWQRGASVQSSQTQEGAREGGAPDPPEVFGRGGSTFRADVGGRALGQRRPDRAVGHHGPALDVGGGIVEPGAEDAPASEEKRAARALRRTGAVG